MILNYFQKRSYLGNLHSSFRCDEACSRPGCTHPDMQIPVSVFDVMGVAAHRNEPVQEVFRSNYYLGVLEREGFDWIKSVSVKLRKPCPFFQCRQCSIYEFRPLCCMLFPEHQALAGALKTLAAQSHYRDYLCLRTPFSVPKQRVRAINTLWQLYEKERLVSDRYLFDRSPFLIDFGNCVEELVKHSHGAAHQRHDTKADSGIIVPLASFELLFSKTFAHCTPFAKLEERIRGLAEELKREELISDLNDPNLAKSLAYRDSDRSDVHRYVNGKLHVRKQSLVPFETMLIW